MTDNITTIEITTVATGYIWMIGLALSIILTIIAIWSKAALVYLAALICWVGSYLEIPMNNTYYNVGIGIMALYCVIAGFWNFGKKRSGRG